MIVMVANVLTILLGGYFGCSTLPVNNPFNVEKTKIFEQVKVIAMAPIKVPDFLENSEEIQDRYHRLIIERLRESQFSITPPSKWSPIFKKLKEKQNGNLDIKTRQLGDSKDQDNFDLTWRELKMEFDVDAVLVSKIKTQKIRAPRVGAGLMNYTISWDGTKEPAIGYESADGCMTWLAPLLAPFAIFEAQRGDETIEALSLHVTLVDQNHRTLYTKTSGIQLLHKWSKTELKYVPASASSLFREKKTDEKAVRLALGSLVEK